MIPLRLQVFLCVQCLSISRSFRPLPLPGRGTFACIKESRISRGEGVRSLQLSRTRSTANAADENSSSQVSEDELDVHHVSEATALLACRAYLQRKHRLGRWQKWTERQRLRDAGGGVGAGFFWEDTSELKYYSRNKRRKAGDFDARSDGATMERDLDSSNKKRQNVDDLEVTSNEDLDESGGTWELASYAHTMQDEEAVDDLCDEADEQDRDLQEQDEGTGSSATHSTYDEFPPQSFLKRSEAARLTWSLPQFREKWYKARWGAKKKKANREEDKLRRSSGIPFPMEELAAMTEDEISHAIRTYVSSKQKRSVRRAETTSERQESLSRESSTSDRASLDQLLPTDDLLKIKRQERSMKAAKAYQKRIQNQQHHTHNFRQKEQQHQSGLVRTSPPRRLNVDASGDSVVNALQRIELSLMTGSVPAIEDLERILQPTKLTGRKDVLRRILASQGFRGKCVPPLPALLDKNPCELDTLNTTELTFVTQASVDHLGAFCIYLLKANS